MPDARDRQSDLAVMEAEEFQQKRLLARIIDGRERFAEIANKARERYIMGDIDEDGQNTLLLYAAQDYIETAWTLLRAHSEGEDGDTHYLLEKELGQIALPGDRAPIVFEGLYDVLTANELYHCEVRTTVSYPHGPDQETTTVESFSVPREVSRRAVRTMDEFLANEQGIELKVDDMDDSLPSFGYDTIHLDKDELDVETIGDIKEAIKSDVDARVLTEGELANGDGEEEVEA